MIHLVQLEEVCHGTFETLLNEAWGKNWDDDVAQQIVQWRYYDRPGGAVTWLAVEEGHCVAMLDSMLRPYLLDGQRVMVRETADWYCTPTHRSGVGLWLLRQLALYPDPVIVMGGSSSTVEILSKLPRSFNMQWMPLPMVSSYVLPIKMRGLAANLIRQHWWEREKLAVSIPNFLPARKPKRIAAPTSNAAIRLLADDDAVSVTPPARQGLVQLLETPHWQWLAKMPHDLAQPLGLLFSLDDKPVGVSFSQIEPAATGLDARIVHLQCQPSHTRWIASETAQFLMQQGVGFIRCCVSSDDKIEALKDVGFVKAKEVPCHWLPREAPTIPTTIDVSYLRGDDAMPFQALRGRYV